jgi:hypothetical protein
MKNAVELRLKKLPIVLDEFSMKRGVLDEIEYFDTYSRMLDIKTSRWSVYETIGHMDDPVPTTATTLRYALHWGPRDVVIDFNEGITWSDLWKLADRAIEMSGDFHHIFIESFVERNGELVMYTGS